ncbi:DUF6011 domain-containing protein [Streptomyces sp. NPDC093109]|uniref:DUF6011 domain-containing protein n=1 Tax=Streptomyces sp. NPDC093109 TaxID=3154977 RepID=UPI00344C7936
MALQPPRDQTQDVQLGPQTPRTPHTTTTRHPNRRNRPTSGGPSSSCRECGRPLTDELSRLAGYGPTCARYLLI